jgi:hypothetical protein
LAPAVQEPQATRFTFANFGVSLMKGAAFAGLQGRGSLWIVYDIKALACRNF